MADLLIVTTGSREWPDGKNRIIYDALQSCMETAKGLGGKLIIRVGDARGADRVIYLWAHTAYRKGWPVTKPIRYEADWRGPCTPGRCQEGHRRKSQTGPEVCPLAGYIRNERMVHEKPKPQLCLAFIYRESRGATHTRNEAERAGIDVVPFILS